MKNKWLYSSICILLFLCFIMLIVSAYLNISQQTVEEISDIRPTIIIDAGHGGEDGGASSSDGTMEKDINLDISLKLTDMLKMLGFSVTNVRTTDISVYDNGIDKIASKKSSDLKNRLKLFNSSEDNVVISIHQNKFSQSIYSGAQVFYSKTNGKSAVLAESVRKSVVGLLQPENTRECKPAEKNIYILYNTTVPAVIIECGFLSNENEATKLKNEEYRSQMAYSICLGFLEYYNNNY